ncbi:MFS transporter [Scleromatobacter humisilvae]|uniref:Multidrug efflux pump Tap n=1 Tax=Scleromatobacter humisilvae TaxID=2897159 RepID=A0A9X2BZA1_9BURK|nr:MFS transporter [Scleromatobacter humisilvae]MCK9685126.1 MFS transporter [Scleromatobacter humisilvae]
MRVTFPFKSPLPGTSFHWLLWSDALTLLSMMVGAVALPWWIAQSGGAHDLAVYGVLAAAMGFVALPLLSPFVDRHSKRSLMVVGLLGFGISGAAMAAFASWSHYRLDVVVAIAAIAVLANALVQPATNSIVTELVPPAGLSQALGLQQSAQAAGRLVGPAIAGAVLAAVGTAWTLWLGALLLFAAALLATRLPRPDTTVAPPPRRAWATEFRVGLRVNWAIPIERGWVLCNFVAALVMMPCVTMLVPLKVQSLGLSAAWLGWCEAALSLGLLVGSLGPATWWTRAQGRFATRVTSAALIGVGCAIAGWTSDRHVLVAMFALMGFASAATNLVGKTHRMLARPLAFRARMSAAAIMTTQVSQTLGPAIAGLALVHWSLRAVYLGFGLASIASALGFFLIPGFRAFMALDHEQVDGFYARTYPQVFETA